MCDLGKWYLIVLKQKVCILLVIICLLLRLVAQNIIGTEKYPLLKKLIHVLVYQIQYQLSTALTLTEISTCPNAIFIQ